MKGWSETIVGNGGDVNARDVNTRWYGQRGRTLAYSSWVGRSIFGDEGMLGSNGHPTCSMPTVANQGTTVGPQRAERRD